MRVIVAIVLAVACTLGAVLLFPDLLPGRSTTGESATEQGGGMQLAYVGDADAEASLVEIEERRVIDVRSIANATDWTGAADGLPYRLVTGSTFTLVLVERAAPYSLENVVDLGALVLQPDGSYLLREHIVVEEGATLDLSGEGLEIRLASSSESFVSIVTLGGDLTIKGTASRPVDIVAWDTDLAQPDLATEDGRAYVRVVGGHADLSDVRFENLGFWSGRTGGVSLTGTELPDADAEGVLPNPIINGQEIIPSGQQLETLALDGDISGYGTVSAFVRNVSFTGNAFGLFVSSADGVMVQNSTVLGSLVDGLVFHRNVRNSEIQSTESSANAGDGIVVTRATTGNVLTRVTASGNGRNGITLEGGPLADGPSATGTPIGVYGDNQVTDSVASDNGRYGIHVDGGAGIRVDGNIFAGNEMGVVVSEAATAVTIANNEVLSSSRQGIALRESGTDLVVEDNVVRGGEIGIYARNAGGTFERNEVGEVTSHAITLVGETGASVIAGNTVAGVGPSAIDIARTSDVAASENDADSWTSTKPLDVVIRNFLQPLTVLWLTLGLLVVVSAVSGVKRRDTGIRHPYANLAPMSTFTRGVVSRDAVAAERAEKLEPVT
jgi:parallel beta-helix repeat protein